MSDEPPIESPWPLEDQLKSLEALDPDELRGTARLGALAFEQAPENIGRIVRILRELRMEPWDDLPRTVRDQATSNANDAVNLAQQMLELRSDQGNAQDQKQNIERQLVKAVDVFVNNIRPHCRISPAMEAVAKFQPDGLYTADLHDAVRAEEVRLEEFRRQGEALERRLRELEPLVQAQREAVGEVAAEEFSKVYADNASVHRQAWKLWLKVTVGAVVLTLIGGAISLNVTHESNPTVAEAIFATTVNLLIIGILLFVVRVAAHQFRVHRHLEAVDTGKAAALTTFNRLVQGQTDEVRTAMASVLSQAVFASHDTGFIDGSGDHVTLIERVVGPAIQRASPPQ